MLAGFVLDNMTSFANWHTNGLSPTSTLFSPRAQPASYTSTTSNYNPYLIIKLLF